MSHVSTEQKKMADDCGEVFASCELDSVRQSVRYAEQRDKVQFVRQRSSKGFGAEG